MKIAIDCRMIGSGGIGSFISSLIPLFCNEFECLLIGKESQIKTFKDLPNATLVTCEIDTFSIKELLFFPKNIISKINSCDVYYTPYCNIPSGIKIPIFSTIHDIVFLDVPGLASKTGTLIRKLFYKYAIYKSEQIFTDSFFSKERIISQLKCKKNITVTYSAVPSWFINSTDLENNNNTNDSTKSILFVGNIKKHKGLSILLDAFNKALINGLDAKLTIVGNADNFRTGDNEIVRTISTIDTNKIEFTGKISNEELANYYRNASLLVQPSFYEGFGMPPLEAMKLGTNALISDIPVFKEIYKDFPVTYFKVGDSEDLSKKLIQCIDLPTPENIPDIYTFENTYSIIKNIFLTNTKNL